MENTPADGVFQLAVISAKVDNRSLPMKTVVLVVLLVSAVVTTHAEPQRGARHYANKATPKSQRTEAPPAPPAPPAAPGSPAPANGASNAAPVVRGKSAEEKQEIVERTVEYQRKRAEKGNDVAQYDYGMRFLRGEGVEKDLATARKWLERSAAQGNSLAKKQIEDLDKKPAESGDATKK